MPITLGCPKCMKRFRARDESAGKKVKCPYCQEAVQVPTPEESGATGVPAPLPSSTPSAQAGFGAPAARGAPPPSAPVISSPDDWGALPTGGAATSTPSVPAPRERERERQPAPAPLPSSRRGEKERPKPPAPSPPPPPPRPAKERPKPIEQTPDAALAGKWKRARRGLFCVQFALFCLLFLGFVGIGKEGYERGVGPLPKGDGKEWLSIAGFVNDNDKMAIPVSKEQMIDLGCYGIPILLGGIFLVFGRLIASGAPRVGGGGVYGLSSLFTLSALIAIGSWTIFSQSFPAEAKYGMDTFVVVFPLAEFLFLVSLTASGSALKRSSTVRRVGFLGVLVALAYFGVTQGWDLYKKQLKPQIGNQLSAADLNLAELGAQALAWALIIFVYWLAVRSVRSGARELIDTARGYE
jgi:phage FluMu protein Com